MGTEEKKTEERTVLKGAASTWF